MAKTKQASIRFDPEKLELVKRREKLLTSQKVVDFLMDAYWWNNKLILAPAMKGIGETLPYVAQEVPKTPYETYELELQHAGTTEELETVGRRLERDSRLKPKEKEMLHQLGQMRVQSIQ